MGLAGFYPFTATLSAWTLGTLWTNIFFMMDVVDRFFSLANFESSSFFLDTCIGNVSLGVCFCIVMLKMSRSLAETSAADPSDLMWLKVPLGFFGREFV